MALPGPVDELDAELEGAAGLPEESRLVDSQPGVEMAHRRNRCLTDPNGTDLFRLDQCDGTRPLRAIRKGSSSHPAGRAAAEDDYPLNGGVMSLHF